MTNPQRVLLHYFTNPGILEIKQDLLSLTSEELGEFFVHSAFLSSAVNFLKDEHWLHREDIAAQEQSFQEFLAPYFGVELFSLRFLQAIVEKSSAKGLKEVGQQAQACELAVIQVIKSRTYSEQKVFAAKALNLMLELFDLENKWQVEKKAQGLHLGLSMYRTFDALDDVFNLDYSVDLGMKADLQETERLWEGAGVGVQSGYSTVSLALRHLNLPLGSRFIDLGSGYGRVGLIVGLLRPDIDFKGYEYVAHRVDIASSSSLNLGMQDHVHFYTQDLSLESFKIPEAEIYYMYDPFSEETYAHVLAQLVEISRYKKIAIATKGNARGWLLEVARREQWSTPEEFDNGNLCLFRS
ncbi:SAM-dependent methyltransferase [Bdellovibrio sp. HCB-110]|uniref:SAM-dependent methyltransferase n=1 Tax=Bdellovibrio sp. HCB-110 TaxID=3391182 RepID=UPI0039B4BF7F